MRELSAAAKTIVLLAHDMQEADQLADRVTIIDHGRLLAVDTRCHRLPAARPDLHLHWVVLLTLTPIGALMCSSLGLFLGTALDPRSVIALFAIMLTPLLYLGCTLYPWSTLGPNRWVQVRLNPLTYVSEGFRAAVTPAHHLNLYVIYPALIALHLRRFRLLSCGIDRLSILWFSWQGYGCEPRECRGSWLAWWYVDVGGIACRCWSVVEGW